MATPTGAAIFRHLVKSLSTFVALALSSALASAHPADPAPAKSATSATPSPTPEPAAAIVAAEYEVKAEYLYNFGKFVSWPQEALTTEDPLVICVVGKDPFGAVLDETVRGKTVQERPLEVRRLATTERVRECHILFVPAAEEPRLPQIRRNLEGANVLTVGETEEFVRKGGGAIALLTRGQKVRFEVNLRSARNAGLELSSQLLKLASAVLEEDGSH